MNSKPTILITNDDGYQAKGLRKLISLMQPLGKVVVISTSNPMSARAHSITIAEPLRIKQIANTTEYCEYICNGTPVDCVKLGYQTICKPDLVVSGINHGSNASVNVVYSATMGAVIEACMDGIPAIGFSLNEYGADTYFDHVEKPLIEITHTVLDKGLPQGICLNVNFPKYMGEDIKGIKICRQAMARWEEEFDTRCDPWGSNYYWLTGSLVDKDQADDTDNFALNHNYVSVVPTQYDLTAHQAIKTLQKWNLK